MNGNTNLIGNCVKVNGSEILLLQITKLSYARDNYLSLFIRIPVNNNIHVYFYIFYQPTSIGYQSLFIFYNLLEALIHYLLEVSFRVLRKSVELL